MNRPFAHLVAVAILSMAPGSAAGGQISLRSTPAPTVTAGNEAWYLSGSPILYDGNVYYPAGAAIHFVRDEMVSTGTFGNVPIYVRTTQEPGSIIYVPLAGGVMRPFERRRSGDLAGTVGSSAPSFVVTLPAEEALTGTNLQAAATPTGAVLPPPGPSATIPPAPVLQAVPRLPAARPAEVGTTGTVLVQTAPARTRVQTVQRPVGVNAVFIQFQGARWYSAGPPVAFSAGRFVRIGEHGGFLVYGEKGQPGTIYLSLLEGNAGMVAPYKVR